MSLNWMQKSLYQKIILILRNPSVTHITLCVSPLSDTHNMFQKSTNNQLFTGKSEIEQLINKKQNICIHFCTSSGNKKKIDTN